MSPRTFVLIAALSLPPAAMATEAAEAAAPRTDAPAVTAPKKAPVCPMITGSRIRPSAARGCEAPKPFRSYSAEELQRTGEIDLNEALRKLDTIFR